MAYSERETVNIKRITRVRVGFVSETREETPPKTGPCSQPEDRFRFTG